MGIIINKQKRSSTQPQNSPVTTELSLHFHGVIGGDVTTQFFGVFKHQNAESTNEDFAFHLGLGRRLFEGGKPIGDVL